MIYLRKCSLMLVLGLICEFYEVVRTYDSTIFFNVIKKLKSRRVTAVEDIQDLIEKELYKGRYFDVMRSFLLYRHMHKMQRDQFLEEDTTYINSTQTIEEYINGSDWRIKANSNTGYLDLIRNIEIEFNE